MNSKTPLRVGLDFGTTNSTIACRAPSGDLQIAHFPFSGGLAEAYRSLLYFEKDQDKRPARVHCWTGPQAIDRYLETDTKGRLIQSLKSFLSSRTLQGTEVFGRRYSIEDFIARILIDMREAAEKQFEAPIRDVTVGRPVHFVGAESEEDDQMALERTRVAFQKAGFATVSFEMEPVAAAYYYESGLDHDELILIGDFGGGTSDFSILRVGPKVRQRGRKADDLLGTAGVGFAGDAFDSRIVRHVVAPSLGAGSSILSMEKVLPVPSWIYRNLERWHYLSFLRSSETLTMLHNIRAQSLEPDKIGKLLDIVTQDLGFHLHGAVQRTKCHLSEAETAPFHFAAGSLEIDAVVARTAFEEWIGEELQSIEACLDSLFQQTGVDAKAIDKVFLTGGTSFVPSVRRIFERRFGGTRIRTGNEFTSVARGLALAGD